MVGPSGALGPAMGSLRGLNSTGGSGGPIKVPFAIEGMTSDPKFIPEIL